MSITENGYYEAEAVYRPKGMYSADMEVMSSAIATLKTTGGSILQTFSNVLYSGFSQAVSAGAANQQIKTWADDLLEELPNKYKGISNCFTNSVDSAVKAFNRYAESVENTERVSGVFEDPGIGTAAEIKSINGSVIFGDAEALGTAKTEFLNGLNEIVESAETIRGLNFGFVGGNVQEELQNMLNNVIRYIQNVQTAYERNVSNSIETHIENLKSGLTVSGGN